MKRFLSYLLPVALCFALGFIASNLQTDAIQNWYPYLNKPTLTPPNAAFPIAWSIIYLLSGLSVGIIINTRGKEANRLFILWGVQQFFNFSWSIMFFALQNPMLGFINILILDVLVIIYILKAWPVNKVASIMFWPYILWILFATYLNGYILFNN